MRTILLALAPRFAQAIYDGAKGFEFRRVAMQVEPGDLVVIYESAPVSQVTGHFTIGAMRVGSPAEMLEWAGTAAGAGAAEYLEGARVSTALQVTRVYAFARGHGLEEMRLGPPPMSYRFMSRT